ncbi:hypothetical protein E4O97_16945 [Pseudomonas sp. W15Feb34]|nr:hypothetical protein [Pseudomonas sp. W15Feb34]
MRPATDGVHINGRGSFCHVVLRHFACRAILAHIFIASPSKHGGLAVIVQIALPQNAIIANCNPKPPHRQIN